jgi:hypothetical protein
MNTFHPRHVLLAVCLLMAAAAGHSRAPTVTAEPVASTPLLPTPATIDGSPQAPFEATVITTMETVGASATN